VSHFSLIASCTVPVHVATSPPSMTMAPWRRLFPVSENSKRVGTRDLELTFLVAREAHARERHGVVEELQLVALAPERRRSPALGVPSGYRPQQSSTDDDEQRRPSHIVDYKGRFLLDQVGDFSATAIVYRVTSYDSKSIDAHW